MISAWYPDDWLIATIFGNTVLDYAVAALVFAILLLLFKAVQTLVIFRLERAVARTRTDLDDTIIQLLRTVRPSVYTVAAAYLSLRSLHLSPLTSKIINAMLVIVVVVQTIAVLQVIIDYITRHRGAGRSTGETDNARRFISTLAKATLWIVGLLFILSNIGVNVISLIAGLGVGGIAVALAAQNVLSDLFSSLALYFDHPFAVGDFIVVDTIKGTVRQIGIKTTRLQSLDGEEIIVANRELASARIKNYRRLQERRVAFNLKVSPATPAATLQSIPALLEKIISAVPNTRFDRAHFYSFDTTGLVFRVVYHVTIKNFRPYLDARQTINYRIREAFAAAGIDFA